MRLVKTLSKIVSGIIILLAIGGYWFVRNFDLNRYKVYVQDIVENAIGRNLEIKGEASLGISLVPTIVVKDVYLENADWAKNRDMLALGELEIKFAVLPLLKKQIVIDKIIINNLQVYLEQRADGEKNWIFSVPKSSAEYLLDKSVNKISNNSMATSKTKHSAIEALLVGFVAKQVEINDGLVEYVDDKSLKQQNFIIKNIAVSVPNANEQILWEANVEYNGKNISGNGTMGALSDFVSLENYPFEAKIKAWGISAELNGSVADALHNPRYATMIKAKNPSQNLGAPEISVQARIDGDINSLSADIKNLAVNKNNIKGIIKLDWSGDKPKIIGDVQADNLNIGQLVAQPQQALIFPKFSLINEAQAITSVPTSKIPYDWLEDINADVRISVGKLKLDENKTFGNVKAKLKLNNGYLQINPLTAEWGQGKINAEAEIWAQNKMISIKAKAQDILLKDINEEFWIENNSDFGIVSGGVADAEVELGANGDTWRKLSETVDGRVIAIVGKTKIQTGKLQFWNGNFVQQLLNAIHLDTKKIHNMDLTCAVLRSDIKQGKANFPNGLVFDSKQFTLISEGHINLVNDKISFTIEPAWNKLVNSNVAQVLASFIKIRGTLEKPKIRIDDSETIKTAIGIAATGGLPYIGSQMFLNGSGSPCYMALEGTNYAKRFPKPTGVRATSQDVYRDTTKQIKQSAKDLEHMAKDLFKMLGRKNNNK